MTVLHAQVMMFDVLQSTWDNNVQAFAHYIYTYYYDNPDRKVGTFAREAAIDWFVTLRPSFGSLFEISEDCPQQKLIALHNLPAQGFGSAPVDEDAYNKAHWWTHVLQSTYHDYFLYEVSKQTLGGFSLDDDDDESLFTKAHRDQTCRPQFGQTCEPFEVMAYSEQYSINPYANVRSYYGEPFFTHYPPVFLANTAVVIFQAYKDDPANFDAFFDSSIISGKEYSIGNSKSIFWHWMHSLPPCDFGKKYSVTHWTFEPTRYYRGQPASAASNCNDYYEIMSSGFLGNYWWTADFNPSFWSGSGSPSPAWGMFERHPTQYSLCYTNTVDADNCKCDLPLFYSCNCTAIDGW